MQSNVLYLYCAFLTSGHSTRFTIEHSPIHAHIHTPTAMSTMQGTHPQLGIELATYRLLLAHPIYLLTPSLPRPAVV